MLSVAVLGRVEVRRDGDPLPVRRGKTTEVLVRLALEAGVTVRAERLIEDLWGEGAVATQKNTLQTKISRLRKELGDPTLVTGDPSGYTLRIEPAAVDALEVVRLAWSTRELLDAGDARSALQLSTDALSQFRGDVLRDAGDGDWVVPHRTRLEEVRLQLTEDRVAARAELGATGAVIGELESLVAEHPLRERLWVLLITALYRDGRQADALASYTRVRTVLAEELGLEPGPELRTVEHQVLGHDPGLDRVAPVRPGNLPALSSTLIGRHTELDTLVPLVTEGRLVTIVGTAGVGKTRLAVAVAETMERSAGVWLVRLEAAATDADVAETIAATLQVADGGERTLLDRLRGAEVQLVLDNCEHVVDGVADLVTRILDGAPRVKILCTSQVPLGLAGEAVFELRPLTIDDSMELFAQRATEQRRSFTLDAESAATLRGVCGSLDGLPLAIELAAARAKTLSVGEIARRLDDRFAFLRDATTRRPSRRRALAEAIDWSYELLFPDDQHGLWALACFTGGASLPAVEDVTAALGVPVGLVLDVIDRLVHRSLVVVDEDHGELRYRLLESVRAFARERLRDSRRADQAFAAHAGWYAAAADLAAAETRGPGQARQLAFVRRERANIDAALGWAWTHDPRVALRIANGFGWAWVVIGDGAVAAARLRSSLDAAADLAPAPDRVIAWSHIAWLAAGNDIDRARAAAEAAIAAADPADEYLAAWARLARAFVFVQEARPTEALELLDECRATFHRLGRGWEEGSACVLTVHAALPTGDGARAASACADAEPIVRPLGDDWGIGHLDAILGRVAMAEGRYDAATVHLRGAADAAARLGFATSEGYHLVNLGRARYESGDADTACDDLRRAVNIGTTTAELRLAAIARTHLGHVLLMRGDDDAGRAVLTVADEWFRASGGGDGADLAASLLRAAETPPDQ